MIVGTYIIIWCVNNPQVSSPRARCVLTVHYWHFRVTAAQFPCLQSRKIHNPEGPWKIASPGLPIREIKLYIRFLLHKGAIQLYSVARELNRCIEAAQPAGCTDCRGVYKKIDGDFHKEKCCWSIEVPPQAWSPTTIIAAVATCYAELIVSTSSNR